MRIMRKFTLRGTFAVLAGATLGVAAMQGLQAAQRAATPAYVISNIQVTDPANYQKYAEASAAALGPFHGTIIVRGGKTVVFDGQAPHRVIVIKFPSLADARRWRASREFEKLRPLQQQSSTYIESFAIEGVE